MSAIATHYDLNVVLDGAGLTAEAAVTVVGDGRPLALYLHPAAVVDCPGTVVSTSRCNQGRALRLELGAVPGPGREACYRIRYTLPSLTGPDFLDAAAGCCLRGHFESLWFPTPGRMWATANLDLTVPPGLTPVLPGQVEAAGDGRFRVTLTQPHADLDLLALPWRSERAGRLTRYLTAAAPDAVDFVTEIAARALAFYEDWLGRPAPDPFRLAELPAELPAVANTGLLALPPSSFTTANPFRTINFIAHEVAHTWWGGYVTGAGPESDWLSEALAHFSQLRLVESLLEIPLERQAAQFAAILADSPLAGSPLSALTGGTAQEWQALRAKGTLFFINLFNLLGPASLNKALRDLAGGPPITLPGLALTLGVAEVPAAERLFQEWVLGA